MSRVVPLAVHWLVWWLVLEGLWIGFVGTVAGQEVVAGVAAGAVAATAFHVARGAARLTLRVDWLWLARGRRLPRKLLYELAVVLGVLVDSLRRRQRPGGSFATVPFPAGRSDPSSRWRRAFATTAETTTPNSVVLDIDVEQNEALLFVLDRRRFSGRVL